tara:strand:- start:233 stop:415 length:183 start_codon:yes stop_codon:yes gene_type:complete
METQDTTLIVVIANLILQPLLQYLLHSRCSRIKCCGIECDREVLKNKEELEDIKEENLEL